MNEIVKKYAGPFSKLTASHRINAASNSTAATGIAYELSERRARSGACALTSVATRESQRRYASGEASLPRCDSTVVRSLPDQAGRGNERLDRHELLAGLPVDRDRRQVDVAGRVDREVADDAVRDLDAEDRLRRLRPITSAGRYCLQHDLHGLRAVLRVRVRLRADLLAERLDERRTLTGEALRRLARDADVRAVADRAVRARIAEAVRHLQLEPRVDRLEVLHQLRAVVADDAAEEHCLRPGRLDQVRERLVAGLLRIPALEADDVDPELLRRVLVRRRDAEAVRLLVVQHVDLRVALCLGPHRIR